MEQEALGSSLLSGPEGVLAKEGEKLKHLKCLQWYGRRYGMEALRHRQAEGAHTVLCNGPIPLVPLRGAWSVDSNAQRLPYSCLLGQQIRFSSMLPGA